jgi:hypothetical protein
VQLMFFVSFVFMRSIHSFGSLATSTHRTASLSNPCSTSYRTWLVENTRHGRKEASCRARLKLPAATPSFKECSAQSNFR